MNHTRFISALAAATLGFAFAADAVAGITFTAVAGDTFVSGPTTSTLTVPPINWVLGTAAPASFSRFLKNGVATAAPFTSVETPLNQIWINNTPGAGTVPASGQSNITITFIAAFMNNLAPGPYNVKYTYTTTAVAEPKIAILEINVNVISPAPKLSVAGPLSVETQYTVGDPLPAAQFWAITNTGGPGTFANWAVTETPDVPWLTLLPASGAQAPGAPTNSIGTLDIGALTAGTYATTLKFRNLDAPNDLAQSFDIPYTLILSNPKFVPGQRLVGSIPTVDKVRTIDVDVIAGLKLTFKVKTTEGTLKPKLTILDSLGAELKTFAFKKSKKFVNKTFTFPVNGTFTIHLAGNGTTMGSFEVLTARKLPKLALPRSVKNITASQDYVIIEVPTLVLKGALLNVNIVGLTFDANTLTRTFLTPVGSTYNVTSFTQVLGNNTYYVQVPLTQSGQYTLRLSGFNTKDLVTGLPPSPLEKCTVTISPFQPVEGDGSVDLDVLSP